MVKLLIPKEKDELRTAEQLKNDYEIEKRLAEKLRNAPKEARSSLYTALYDEMYRLTPHHPQLTRKSTPDMQKKVIHRQMSLIQKYLHKESLFCEIGSGDCALSFEVCSYVSHVYSVDVSLEITKSTITPDNFSLIISPDGTSIPIESDSITFAYSNQLMEHLHPDDAYDQLKSIYNILSAGGRYMCMTPNALIGPADISKYFTYTPTGFHLKEYTTTELYRLFKRVGFSKVTCLIGKSGVFVIPFPIILIRLLEYLLNLLNLLPYKIQKRITRSPIIRPFLGIRLIGQK